MFRLLLTNSCKFKRSAVHGGIQVPRKLAHVPTYISSCVDKQCLVRGSITIPFSSSFPLRGGEEAKEEDEDTDNKRTVVFYR